MSATLSPDQQRPALVDTASRSRARRKRVWTAVAVLAVISLAVGGFVLFAWSVNEVRFDRPSAAFDDRAREIEALPGVDDVQHERWVEAPLFGIPNSTLSIGVARSGLPELLDLSCSNGYEDAVAWSIRVRAAAAEVVLNSAPTTPGECPDFGFDAIPLVDELARVAPKTSMQPSVWQSGVLSLVAPNDDPSSGIAALLPVLENAANLVAAAGMDAEAALEVNSAHLGVIVAPGEQDEYVSLLRALIDERGVMSFWASGGWSDGVERIQVVAPEAQHGAIERLIASADLSIADLPVRFIEQ
jgi:hypothetical protein